jgi:electron transfer flavoprotein beta subunit
VEILVCVRRVPHTSGNEISISSAGNDIERDELVYSINEPDNYAVKEALQRQKRRECHGGHRRWRRRGDSPPADGVGANHGVLLTDSAFDGSDGRGIAAILKAFVEKGKFDLILTGVQAEDGGAQVGGMLAAMLDYPFASLVNSIEVLDGGKLKISREIEGGNKEISVIDLPCVLSIQTGINEPRYVGMRGIRAVASVPIPTYGAQDLGINASVAGAGAAKVKRLDYFIPAAGKGAEMLEGEREENIEKLVGLLAAKGGLK